MRRLALVVACMGLFLAACGGPENGAPAPQPKPGTRPEGAGAQPADRAGSEQAKTPIVRSLLEALDDVEGEDDDVERELRHILREADEELSQVLGENSRRLIEDANKKPPAPVVGSALSPVPKTQIP